LLKNPPLSFGARYNYDNAKGGGRMLPEMRINGEVAELIVTADLIKQGALPFKPVMENGIYDLLTDCNGEILRVQIKSSNRGTDRSVKFDLERPSAADRHYAKDAFDVLALYDTQLGRTAYLDWRSLPHKRSITLRYDETVVRNSFSAKTPTLNFASFSEFPPQRLGACG
jgi:hypothetical protein